MAGKFCGEIGVVAFVDEVGERQLVDAGEQAGHESCYTFGETVTRPVLLAAPLCRVAEAGTRAPAVGRAVGARLRLISCVCRLEWGILHYKEHNV